MATKADLIVQSSESDGRWKIAFTPKAENPLSVAKLISATSKNLTYSFTPDGFAYSRSQATVNDPRLTLIQDLSRPGKVTDSLELKYVKSADADSADQILTEGLEGHFTARKSVDNNVEWTIGQEVMRITFKLGVKRPEPPTENGVDVVSQTAYITAVTVTDAVLVA